jgi:hypothetical protein
LSASTPKVFFEAVGDGNPPGGTSVAISLMRWPR